MITPHIDIDFMSGSLHWRLAEDGSLTRPMQAGRACRIKLGEGAREADVAALSSECQGQLARLKAGYVFGRGFSADAAAALDEIREAVALPRPRNAPTPEEKSRGTA